MTIYKKHVFVCENQRDSNDSAGCCASKGAKEITLELKKYCKDANLKGKVRVNKAGCLGQCAQGPVLVIYPEGLWFKKVTKEDVKGIFENHIMNAGQNSEIDSK